MIEQRPGWTLSQPFYVDEGYFELDMS